MATKTNISDYRFSIFINNDQAKQSLIEMEKEMVKYEQELRNLEKEGKKDSAEYRERKKALDELNSKMVEARKEAGLNSLSLKELRSLQQALRNEQARFVPHTEQWKKLEVELAAVSARYKELTVSAKSTGLSIGGLADGFNKYFGIITAVIASFTGLIYSFRKVIDTFNEFEKKLDNLSALTGLVGKDLSWLSDQAKTMTTSMVEGNVRITQSADSIVDAYTKVGSARPELLKNKEDLNMVTKEAIILSEAANTELQPAVTALTGVLNQFNAPASDSRRIINALAAGSKEGAGEIPYLTEAIEKSGTVAADAGLSYEQLVGTIETLAPRMTQPEMAGRSLRAILIRLQEGANDTNPAIVGMEKALENLGKKNLSVTELVKIFGVENITAGKILINNVGELKKYTAAVTGTNVALEQAAINTDNNSSKLEQAKNRVQLMSIELGEKLAPALTFSTNAFSYLMKAILGSISFFNEHKAAVLSALAAITAYTIAVNIVSIAHKVAAGFTWLWDVALKGLFITMKSSPWGWVAAGIAAAVTFLLTYKKTVDETVRSQERLNDIKKSFNDKMNDERAELDLLFQQLKKTNTASTERQNLIDTINQRYGTTLKNIKDEKEFMDQLNLTYADLIKNMQKKALLESKEDALKQLYKDRQKVLDEIQYFNENLKKSREASGVEIVIPGDTPEAKKARETMAADQEKYFPQMTAGAKEYKEQLEGIEKAIKEISNLSPQDMSLLTTGKKTEDGDNKPPPTDGGGDAVKYAKKIQQMLEDAKIQIIKEEKEKELKFNELNLKRQLELIKGNTKEEVELRTLLKQQARDKEDEINRKYSDKEFQDNLKIEKEKWEAKISAAHKGSQEWYDLSVEWLDKQQQYELQNTKLTEEQKLQIIEKYQALKAKIQGEVAFTGPVQEKMPIKTDNFDPLFQVKQRKELLARWRDEELDANKDSAGKQSEIWQEYYEGLNRINTDFVDSAINALSTMASSLSDVNQAMSDYENSQLKKDENTNNQKKANLKKQLDAKLISQKQYDAGIEKLDKEMDAKKKQLAHDQAKRQKSLSLVQAIINVAQGITASLASGGILGIILAALVGILGAIQIAYIASTPIPEAFRGRYRAAMSRQAAAGRYDVMGEEDQKIYRGVPFVKSPDSGEYTKPTLFAETGSEIILNPTHTRNLKEKRPDLLKEMMDVPQRAGGSVPDDLQKEIKFIMPEATHEQIIQKSETIREISKVPQCADGSYPSGVDDTQLIVPQIDITINPKSLENIRSFRTDVIESLTQGPKYSLSNNQNNFYSQALKEIPIKFDPEFTEAIKDHAQALRKPTPQKSYIVYSELDEMNRQVASIEADVTK